tara:strand:- start:2573 stop:3169 length:597 start_codon:yes stop_codon:yes gene_type:complete
MSKFFILALLGTLTWQGLWFTPDQMGQRFMSRDQPAEAARIFRDPMQQGVAWFRAGEFKKSEQAFARIGTADSEFNRGNCLIFLGKYDLAVERFDRSLELRPDWDDATINREIALARAKATEQKGGDMGDQKIGADEIKFDKNQKNEGQETEVETGEAVTDQSVQALWLRRIQTKPADFLRAKFSYQLAVGEEPEEAK